MRRQLLIILAALTLGFSGAEIVNWLTSQRLKIDDDGRRAINQLLAANNIDTRIRDFLPLPSEEIMEILITRYQDSDNRAALNFDLFQETSLNVDYRGAYLEEDGIVNFRITYNHNYTNQAEYFIRRKDQPEEQLTGDEFYLLVAERIDSMVFYPANYHINFSQENQIETTPGLSCIYDFNIWVDIPTNPANLNNDPLSLAERFTIITPDQRELSGYITQAGHLDLFINNVEAGSARLTETEWQIYGQMIDSCVDSFAADYREDYYPILPEVR